MSRLVHRCVGLAPEVEQPDLAHLCLRSPQRVALIDEDGVHGIGPPHRPRPHHARRAHRPPVHLVEHIFKPYDWHDIAKVPPHVSEYEYWPFPAREAASAALSLMLHDATVPLPMGRTFPSRVFISGWGPYSASVEATVQQAGFRHVNRAEDNRRPDGLLHAYPDTVLLLIGPYHKLPEHTWMGQERGQEDPARLRFGVLEP